MCQEQTGVLNNLELENKYILGNCNIIMTLWNTQSLYIISFFIFPSWAAMQYINALFIVDTDKVCEKQCIL